MIRMRRLSDRFAKIRAQQAPGDVHEGTERRAEYTDEYPGADS
jgi:hypothetical protein